MFGGRKCSSVHAFLSCDGARSTHFGLSHYEVRAKLAFLFFDLILVSLHREGGNTDKHSGKSVDLSMSGYSPFLVRNSSSANETTSTFRGGTNCFSIMVNLLT